MATLSESRTLANFIQLPAISTLSSLLGDDAELYLVGGAVRDLLSARSPTDIDVATKLTPQLVASRLTAHGIRVIETGIEHGTVTALFPGQGDEQLTSIEITTFRKPGDRVASSYSQTIEEDLSGRDFTINAIALRLKDGAIIDPFHGADDISKKELRAVLHPSSRFKEDPLRILRMIRFGPAAQRIVHAETLSAAKECVSLLTTVAPERIRTEFESIVCSVGVRAAFHMMEQSAILQYVIPELLPSVGCEQNEFHVEDVFEHILTVIERAPDDKVVKLAALFHDIGKPHTLTTDEQGRRHFYLHEEVSRDLAKQVMERLRFSNEEIQQVCTLVALHMRPLGCGAPGVRRIIKSTDTLFDRWRMLKIADAPPIVEDAQFAKELAHFDAMVEVERKRVVGSPFAALAIGGTEILALGVQPGPFVGKILKALNELVLDTPELNTVTELTKKAKELIETP